MTDQKITEQAPPLRGCRKCGSRYFFVHESDVWNARLRDDGSLSAHNASPEIMSITCEECDAEYAASDFAAIDFN